MTVLNRRDERGVATLTLSRPALKNALSTELLVQLQSQLDRVRDSPEVRTVILAGAGDTFCAGADLREFPPDAGPDRSLRRIRLVTQVIAQLRNLEQPTLAVVQGPAYGAGWGLALACDLTIAADDARFSLPEVRKGLRLPSVIVARLVEVVGPVPAARIALGGEAYDAAQGAAAGWVAWRQPDAAQAGQFARDLARELAARPRTAVASVKRVLRPGSRAGLVPPPEYAWTEE
jgi:2-(1,2-epoxy-1,2-dihydrophenyl)acetyl-CoA isomerase